MSTAIAVIGAGSWGTTLAILMANKGHRVSLYARSPDFVRELSQTRENAKYLPGVKIPPAVQITHSLEEAVDGVSVAAIVVPSQGFRDAATRLRGRLGRDTAVVSLTKGFETDTLLRMSEILAEVLPAELRGNIAVLSGPNLAAEVSRGIPTATVVAAAEQTVAQYLQDVFMTPTFRVYTHSDVVGVELGGALKNVIALSVGIADGLGYGDNTRATLITRGLTEIARLGQVMGAELLTFAGLSGLGDLVCTCTSERSRNHQAGIRIGRGEALESIIAGTSMVIEGVRATQAAHRLAARYRIELPITEETYKVLYEGKPPLAAVGSLMGRERKLELEEVEMYKKR